MSHDRTTMLRGSSSAEENKQQENKMMIKLLPLNGAFCGRPTNPSGSATGKSRVEGWGGAVNYAARHPVMLRYHLT